jgi:hypothetical protein
MKYVFALLVALSLSGCSQEWRGFVYPNKNDLSKHIEVGRYDSLEKCRDASLGKLQIIGKRYEGDYECGLNCRPLRNFDGSSDMNVCKKTER